MKNRFQEAHRRRYYPDTAKEKLFKAEQPEFIQPTNQLQATFVKVDFTAGESQVRLDEIAFRAEQDFNDMATYELEQKARIDEFRKMTEERAQKIRRQQFLADKEKLEKVSVIDSRKSNLSY